MRGSKFHNWQVEKLERACRAVGAIVQREHRIVTPRLDGFIDLVVIFNFLRIAIEVELTMDRIRWDILKAIEMKADLLLIVMPTGQVARAAKKYVDELKASGKAAKLPICCLSVGAALERLKDRQRFDLSAGFPMTLTPQLPSNQPQSVSAEGKD